MAVAGQRDRVTGRRTGRVRSVRLHDLPEAVHANRSFERLPKQRVVWKLHSGRVRARVVQAF